MAAEVADANGVADVDLTAARWTKLQRA